MATKAKAHVPTVSWQSVESSPAVPAPDPTASLDSASNASSEDAQPLQRRKSSIPLIGLTTAGGGLKRNESDIPVGAGGGLKRDESDIPVGAGGGLKRDESDIPMRAGGGLRRDESDIPVGALHAKIQHLEQQLTRERIKVRQLQDRIQVAQKNEDAGADAEKKLNKALTLIVQLIGKERVQQHLEANGSQKKDILQSLIDTYKEDTRDKVKSQHESRRRPVSPSKDAGGFPGARITKASPSTRKVQTKKHETVGTPPWRSRIDAYHRGNGVT